MQCSEILLLRYKTCLTRPMENYIDWIGPYASSFCMDKKNCLAQMQRTQELSNLGLAGVAGNSSCEKLAPINGECCCDYRYEKKTNTSVRFFFKLNLFLTKHESFIILKVFKVKVVSDFDFGHFLGK